MRAIFLLAAVSALGFASPTSHSTNNQLNITQTAPPVDDPHFIKICNDENFEGDCGLFVANPQQCLTIPTDHFLKVSSIDTHGRTCNFFWLRNCMTEDLSGTPALTITGQMPYLDTDTDDQLVSYYCTADGLENVQVGNVLATSHEAPAPAEADAILLCLDASFSGLCAFFRADPYECTTLGNDFTKQVSALDTGVRTCVFSIYKDCAYFDAGGAGEPSSLSLPDVKGKGGLYRIQGRGAIESDLDNQFESFYCTDEGLDGNPKRLEASSGSELSKRMPQDVRVRDDNDPRWVHVCTEKSFRGDCSLFLSDPATCVMMTFASGAKYRRTISSLDVHTRTCYFYASSNCTDDGSKPDMTPFIVEKTRMDYIGDYYNDAIMSWWCDETGLPDSV